MSTFQNSRQNYFLSDFSSYYISFADEEEIKLTSRLNKSRLNIKVHHKKKDKYFNLWRDTED